MEVIITPFIFRVSAFVYVNTKVTWSLKGVGPGGGAYRCGILYTGTYSVWVEPGGGACRYGILRTGTYSMWVEPGGGACRYGILYTGMYIYVVEHLYDGITEQNP